MRHLTRRKFVLASASTGVALAAMTGQLNTVAQDGAKPTVVVGSKNYAEQLIVGEMIALMLEDAGYPVERQFNLGGTAVAHEALVAGDLDVYVEYTGTGLIAVLGQELPESSSTPAATAAATPATLTDPAYDIVAEQYPEQFGVEWLEPWGFNNTFAIIVREDYASEQGVETISDLQPLAGDITFAADPEFAVRPDGLAGLEEAYGFEFADVQSMEIGLLYSSLAQGDVDASVGASTDGRIPALDLMILEDDKSFFPPYFAAPIVRQDLLEESPEVTGILNQLSGQISNEEMQAMNYDVDEGGIEPIDVARNFLEEQGVLASGETLHAASVAKDLRR